MDASLAHFLEQLNGVTIGLLAGYLALLFSWPLFLWLEKITPAAEPVPRDNYKLNWAVTFSNLLLAPVFATLVLLFTVWVVQLTGLPSLQVSVEGVGIGVPVIDVLLQGAVIFFVTAFLGDFHYYWWHRAQHTIPFLWELHKLHHSDENLNSTTIFRSHFLEPAGQTLVRGLTIGLIFDLGASQQSLLAIIAGGLFLGLWDFFIHANVRTDFLYRLTPFFSNPQFHWIHHSRLPQHQDKNFSIWLPMYDVAFGTYYKGEIDEYPPTGLSSGEKIETLWEAQTGPLVAWGRGLRRWFSGASSRSVEERTY